MLFLTLAAVTAMVSLASPAMGQDDLLEDSQAFLAKVGADEKAGILSMGQALLIRFQFIFDPGDLPAGYMVQGFSPLKCATDLVNRFHQVRDELDDETRRLIDSYLDRPSSRLSYLSTEGHFLLTYQLSGEDAVPGADLDPANGIPDYVEKVGRYLEQAWTVQVVMTGFVDPLAGTAPCPVSFRAMQNYGYSYIISQNQGTTGLVFHNDFQGFPPNDDPDGPALGAAKVTAAHEFKHASQYRGSRWSEAGWIELDAVWAEELVFDQTNDYYNYLLGGSPIRHPDVPLDGGASGTGYYEDCVFQIWMQETWGVQSLVEFWQRRIQEPAEAVVHTYQQILLDQGAEPAQAWGQFTAWNYATGNRAVPGLGYGEAARYPQGVLKASLGTFPADVVGEIEHLAANFVRLEGWDGSQVGNLQAEFTCEDGEEPMTVTFVVQRHDGTGVLETMDMRDATLASHTLSIPLQDIQAAGIVIGNPDTDGPGRGYQLNVSKDIQPQAAELHLVTTQLQGQVPAGAGTQLEAVLGNTGPSGTVLNYRASVWAEDPQLLKGRLSSIWPAAPGNRDAAQLQVISPGAGQLVALGAPVTVAWNQDGTLDSVVVSLSRDAGQSWQQLAEVPAESGSWQFTAEGPASLECLVRLSGGGGAEVALSPGLFTIYPEAGLVTCPWPLGQIEAGMVASLFLDCDATGFVPGEYLSWLLVQHDGAGLPGVIPLTVRVLPGASPAQEMPTVTVLAGNYPNPFNPMTEILFQLGEAGPVSLEILDVRGHRVCRLLAESRAAGAHRVAWNGCDDQGRSLPAGVYLVRLTASGFEGTSKLLLAR